MKNHPIEPYCKENNLLQLSLFYFGKGRPNKTEVKWQDENGNYELKCVCDYGLPGSFDQDVYTSCMRIYVKQGMKTDKILLNYSDIARELGLSPISWNGKIKKSLKRLAQARYEFTQCFLHVGENGIERINTHFSLFDSATLFKHVKGKSKRNSESELIFPDKIRENLEAKYYQWLDSVRFHCNQEGCSRAGRQHLSALESYLSE